MTEKDIWLSLEEANVEYNEWIARKVIEEGKSYLHLYVEVGLDNTLSEDEFQKVVSHSLATINKDIKDMKEMLDYDPLKPPHMNPTKEQLGVLIKEKKIKS